MVKERFIGMAFDKREIVEHMNENLHIASVGDDGTYGRYMLAGSSDSLRRARRMRPAVEDKVTYLYFVQSKTLGLVKIGFTNDLNVRRSEMQVGSADELYFLGSVLFANRERAESAESEMHSHFQRFQSHGEWFHPDPTLLEFIKKVTTAADVDDFVAKKRKVSKKREPRAVFWPCGHEKECWQSACSTCLLAK